MDTDLYDHPFLIWITYMLKRRQLDVRTKDIVVSEIGGRRFSLGVETTDHSGHPVLGISFHDAEAFKSIKWKAAGIVSGFQNKDWVALSASDIRVPGSDAPGPVSMRLWIPFYTGSLDGFIETSPTKIDLKRVKNGKGASLLFEKSPLMTLPLSINDMWKGRLD